MPTHLRSVLSIAVPVMQPAERWLDRAWQAGNPAFASCDPHHDQSWFPYAWDQASGAVQGQRGAQAQDLSGDGACCAAFLRHERHDAMLGSLVNQCVAAHDHTR